MYGTPRACPLSRLQINLNLIAAADFRRTAGFFTPFKVSARPLAPVPAKSPDDESRDTSFFSLTVTEKQKC